MLKFATDLPADVELALVYWGQSNSRPWGYRDAEGFVEAPELALQEAGYDLTFDGSGNRAWSTTKTDQAVLIVASVDGVTVSTSAPGLVDNRLKQADVRLGTVEDPKVGGGTIVDQRAIQASSSTKTISATVATSTFTWSDHGFVTQAPIKFAGVSTVTGVSVGTEYYVIVVDSNTFKVASSMANARAATALPLGGSDSAGVTAYIPAAYLVVNWNQNIAGAIETPVSGVAGWVTHREERYKAYRTVRVLTQFVPESEGANPAGAPVLPSPWTAQPEIASYSDHAMFLEHTFLEGVEAPGLWSENVGFATASPSGIAITLAASPAAVDIWPGAHVRVTSKASSGGAPTKISYGTVKTIVGARITIVEAAWVGGTPSGTHYDIEVFLPHYENNPHAMTAGYGLRQPNHDPQPCYSTVMSDGNQGRVHARHKGVTTYGYSRTATGDTRFGAMLVTAWRLAQMLGRRVNVIHLGCNSSGMFEARAHNAYGFQGQLGWWNPDDFLDWNPSRTDGAFNRLKRLVTVAGPAALAAEGNTKKLAVIGIVGYQGEADAFETGMRDNYKNAMPTFYRTLRKAIWNSSSLHQLFSSPDKIPVVHAELSPVPYEGGTIDYPYLGTISFVGTGDEDGVVNATIRNFAAKEPFAHTFSTAGRTKLGQTTTGAFGGDPLHFDGIAEVQNGKDAADLILLGLDDAWSSEEDDDDPVVVSICNLALSYVGETAKLQSLSDNSVQAAHCKRYYALARQMLLQRCSWSFATKRGPLEAITDYRSDEHDFAYGVPPNCVKMFEVMPAGAGSDYVTRATASGDLVAPSIAMGINVPQEFTIETDDDGYQIIYTNVEDAVGRWNVLISDASRYPPQFRNALAWQLASMLGGAIMKGDVGQDFARRALQMAEAYLGAARTEDARQREVKPQHTVDWISGR